VVSVNTARVSSLMQPALSESCFFEHQLGRPAAEERTAEQAAAVEAHIAVLRTAGAQHIAVVESTAAEEARQPVPRSEDNSFGPVVHIVAARIVAAHIPVETDNIVVELPEPADSLGKSFDRASGFQRRTAPEN
jgi:hypothetical protein